MRYRLIVVFALGAFMLTGCGTRQIVVEVHNMTSKAIMARLQLDRISGADEVLTQARIEAGSSATLGPIEARVLDPVALVVERPGAVGMLPNRVRLRRGRWSAIVEPGGMEDWSGVKVRVEKWE